MSTVATPGEWQCKIRTGGVWRLAVATGEWAQHFSNASCFIILVIYYYLLSVLEALRLCAL